MVFYRYLDIENCDGEYKYTRELAINDWVTGALEEPPLRYYGYIIYILFYVCV